MILGIDRFKHKYTTNIVAPKNQEMSNVCSRLHGLFSKAKNASNSIKSKLPPSHTQKPTNNDTFLYINRGIKELLDERDTEKMFQKFKYLSQYPYFRKKHKIYTITINRLALAKNFSLVEEALETQKNYITDESFAARIIHYYGKAGMFERAHQLFDELPQRNCERKTKSLYALLVAGLNAGEFDKVYEVFREVPSKLMIKPNKDCYNSVAHALCKMGLFDKAVSLLDEMEENGVPTCAVTFTTIFGALYEKGEFEVGEKVWDRMIKSGVQPSVISYNYKLHQLANDGNMSEVLDMVMELESKGLIPDVATYNALILGSCKNDDLDGVKKWYNELLNCGCTPNKATLETIIPFLCDKGEYGLAFEICKRKFKYQCTVDESLLQKVVDGLAKNSMIKEAETLVGLGKSNGFYPFNLVLPRRSFNIFSWFSST